MLSIRVRFGDGHLYFRSLQALGDHNLGGLEARDVHAIERILLVFDWIGARRLAQRLRGGGSGGYDGGAATFEARDLYSRSQSDHELST
jgi:hypothetical protein